MIEVVIMGGCMGIGNTGPVMEFNIQVIWIQISKIIIQDHPQSCYMGLKMN